MGCDRSGLSTALGEGVNASTPGLALKAEGLGESPCEEARQARRQGRLRRQARQAGNHGGGKGCASPRRLRRPLVEGR